MPFFSSCFKVWIGSLFSLSSRRYRFLNSSHLLGSWPNHFRSSVLGAMSLSHRSTLAFSLVKPRGQSLSTRMRLPSSLSGFHTLVLSGCSCGTLSLASVARELLRADVVVVDSRFIQYFTHRLHHYSWAGDVVNGERQVANGFQEHGLGDESGLSMPRAA